MLGARRSPTCDARQAKVAGVECAAPATRLRRRARLRDPLPRRHSGEHLWDALLAAGEESGSAPFGLEPQRVLRLQKQHIIVGQDTDSESTPFSAAMPWAVKLDKEQDFIGKWALDRASCDDRRRRRSSASRWPTGRVPTEGAVVLDAGGARRPGR